METPAQTSASASSLPVRARVFIAFTILLGLGAAGVSALNWDSPDVLKFGAFLLVTVFGAALQINMPGIAGTFPITCVFALLALRELSGPESVAIAAAGAIAQTLWSQPKRRNLPVEHMLFNAATTILASSVAAWVFYLPWLTQNEHEPAILLLVATLAFFVVHTLPVALGLSIAEGAPLFSTWRMGFFATLPYYFGGAAVAQLLKFADDIIGWQVVLLSGPIVYLIFRSYRLYASRLDEGKKHADAVAALHLRTIEALALAIEAKDQTTHDHLARVQIYCREVGTDLGLSEAEMEALRTASILHDIGKLAVPEHIISKPGRLSPEEFEKMKIHPVVGAEILERVQFPYPVAPIVRAHHEKWDGSGYPNGLRGEQIPIGARILAAVDCLDALASDRQYRRALPLDEAMDVVQKESGKAFDPRVVEILTRRAVELEKMAKAKTADDPGRLLADVKVERGESPAAGFEAPALGASTATKQGSQDFLASIAAARQEVQAIFELSQDLGNSLNVNETMSVLGVRLRNIVPHHGFAIWVRHGDVLKPEYVAGDDFRLFSSLEIPIGQGLSGWVAENSKPILNGNPSVESGYLNDLTKFSTLRSALAVPLEGTSGVTGVLSLYHSERDAFNKDHLRILLAVNSKVAAAIENAQRVQQVEKSPTTDSLTGIPNARSLFLHLDAELAVSRHAERPLTLLALDLDGFKQINDRYGHLEGNRLLKALAAGLKSAFRESDYVARMGGDEFAIILPGAQASDLHLKIEQLSDVVAQACRDVLSGQILTVSVGAATSPQDGADAEQLLSHADRRMYQQKRKRHAKSAPPVQESGAQHWSQVATVH